MDFDQIGNIRLTHQQVAETTFKTVKQIVAWMGVMQAQDYSMAKWAIGVRLPTSTADIIQQAIDKGEILRTHLLRPTWHFVSSDDIYWMLELSAPQIKSLAKSRNKELELTDAVFSKSRKVIETALQKVDCLTREELVTEFKKVGITTDDNRAAHLLMYAELDGLICSGALTNNKQTYALLEERVPKPPAISRLDALAALARRYFLSHGPATLRDFSWWSGLSLTDARVGLEAVKSELVSEQIDSEVYWLAPSYSGSDENMPAAFLLPAFDEFIISYKDRSASLLAENHSKAISRNGLFRPVIAINGKVTGLWKRTIRNHKLIIETDLFQKHSKAAKHLIEDSAKAYGHFLGMKAEVIY